MLSLFEAVIFVLEISAGIAHGRIEPFSIEIIAQVIVGRNLFLLGRFRFRRIEDPFEQGFIQRELARLG